MSFLTAEWRKLAIANYSVDPSVLKEYVPQHTVLDLWNDTCYVSLVGFMFLNTKLLGIPVPFHRNFEEVNLRLYVRYKDGNTWKRGVVFIKEIVPKPALTFVANTWYKEHYQTMQMSHQWVELEDHRLVTYQWSHHGVRHSFEVKAELAPKVIEEGSETEFITEHYWGYTKANHNQTYEYGVTHPKWQSYDVISSNIDVDYAKVYGSRFAFLQDQNPTSVMLAEGSEITVENKSKLA